MAAAQAFKQARKIVPPHHQDVAEATEERLMEQALMKMMK